MQNLTKRDLVMHISNKMGIVQQTVLKVVQELLDHLTEALASGQSVELRNFGVFQIKIRKARVGRNPNKKRENPQERDVVIPPRAVVKFKPGKKMKSRVGKLSPGSIKS